MDRGWAPFVFHIHIYVYTWMTWSLLVPSRSYREARLKFQYESSLRYALNHLHTRFTFHSIIELVLTSWVPCTAKIYPIIYDTTKVGTYIESFIEIVAYGWLGVCVCIYMLTPIIHLTWVDLPWTPMNPLASIECERKMVGFISYVVKVRGAVFGYTWYETLIWCERISISKSWS